MTSITRSVMSATALLLEWIELTECRSESELRTALMGAFMHAKEAHLSLILMQEASPPTGFDKRLDLYLLPSWPPHQNAIAAGELKFYPKGVATDYRTRIGRRLSDIHYVHCLSEKAPDLHGFFVDVVLNPKLVGQECYDSLKKMCNIAAEALYSSVDPIPAKELKRLNGIKSFAEACIDHTPRQYLRRTDYGFLFPPMDLPGDKKRAKRGPAYVKKPNDDKLISIGVRKAGKEQSTAYRLIKINGGFDAAVCFAVFEPGGHLAAKTDDLLTYIGM